jgi:hypothetical protein
LEKIPGLKGSLNLRIFVTADGYVKGVDVLGNTLNDEIIEMCVFGLALEARFPSASRELSYDFDFNLRY